MNRLSLIAMAAIMLAAMNARDAAAFTAVQPLALKIAGERLSSVEPVGVRYGRYGHGLYRGAFYRRGDWGGYRGYSRPYWGYRYAGFGYRHYRPYYGYGYGNGWGYYRPYFASYSYGWGVPYYSSYCPPYYGAGWGGYGW